MAGNQKALQFVTSIHYSKSLLRALNSMTFIYNPSWKISYASQATLPVAFFSVTSMSEVMETEVSQKPMLFYNDGSELDVLGASGSVLNVVADNIILKPKQYKLDCIVPYTYVHPLMGTHYLSVEQFKQAFSMATTGGSSKPVAPYFTLANPYLDAFKFVFKSLSFDASSWTNFFTSAFSTPDYNKASLEAMIRNRTILKMKTWDGWRFKYVVITNMDVSKDGTEKDVYRVKLTMQEMPILTLRSRFKSILAGGGFRSVFGLLKDAAKNIKNGAIVATLDTIERMMIK